MEEKMRKMKSCSTEEITNPILLVSGDIHGELRKLVWNVSNKVLISNIPEIHVIVAGDFGVGFGNPGAMDVLYNTVKSKLEKYNIYVYAVRGNHDDPSYFDGTHDYPRLKFLKDHEVYEICGKKIYPIGGANSVDKADRIEKNLEAEGYGSKKRWWWEGEAPVEKYKDLPDNVDIVISHEAPISFEPVIVRKTEDLDLWGKILSARRYLDYVLNNVRLDWWIHGHYHQSTSGSFGQVKYRGLDIDELFEIRTDE